MDKIIYIKAYEDAVEILKDGVTAKPVTFTNVEGWFIKSLIENLNQL